MHLRENLYPFMAKVNKYAIGFMLKIMLGHSIWQPRKGELGETYHVGGHNEKRNIDVVNTICDLLGEFKPVAASEITANLDSYRTLIQFVEDRPGHDYRYAMDASKIYNELGWNPQETFETGLRKTVQWYLDNELWWKRVQDGFVFERTIGFESLFNHEF